MRRVTSVSTSTISLPVSFWYVCRRASKQSNRGRELQPYPCLSLNTAAAMEAPMAPPHGERQDVARLWGSGWLVWGMRPLTPSGGPRPRSEPPTQCSQPCSCHFRPNTWQWQPSLCLHPAPAQEPLPSQIQTPNPAKLALKIHLLLDKLLPFSFRGRSLSLT